MGRAIASRRAVLPRRAGPSPVAAGDSAADALCKLARDCAAGFDANLRAVLTGDDPEGPHQARVALRRLRTALKAFRPLLHRDAVRPVEVDARRLFLCLGGLRDADVAGGDPVAQAAVRRAVRRDLRRRNAGRFAATVSALFDGAAWQGRGAGRRRRLAAPAVDFAGPAVALAWRRLADHGKSLRRLDDADRHEFRKDLKTLRYLVEFFLPLWPGRRTARLAARLGRLQDRLGYLNDLTLAGHDGGGDGPSPKQVLRKADRQWRRLRRRGYWTESGV